MFEATASAPKPGHGLCQATWSVAHAGPGQASSPGSAQMGIRPRCPKGPSPRAGRSPCRRVVFIGGAHQGRYRPRVNATCPADDGSAPVFGKRPVCRFAQAVTPTASSHARPGVGRAPPGAVGRRIGASQSTRSALGHSAQRRASEPAKDATVDVCPRHSTDDLLIDIVQTSDDSS